MDIEKVDSVTLEWTYEPPDYLEVVYSEEEVTLPYKKLGIKFSKGKATVNFSPKVFPEVFPKDGDIKNALDSLSKDLTQYIKTLLISVQLHEVQLYEPKPFSLNEIPSRTIKEKEGITHKYTSVKFSFSPVKMKVNARVESSLSEEERIVRQEKINKRINETHALLDEHLKQDITLFKMLRGMREALENPKYELVHLYEIVDAIKMRFPKKEKEKLGIDDRDWGKVEEVCNSRKEGRHGGLEREASEPATSEEKKKVRQITRKFIKLYLRYLEKLSSNKSN